MPRLSNLTRQHPVSVCFGYEGETVTVTFDRNRMTQNWARSIKQTIDEGDIQGSAQALFEILIDWDVVDDQDNPLPVSVEILGSLPLAALGALDEAIGEAAVPASEEGNASPAISPAQPPGSTRPQEILRNGQQPSTLPEPSAFPPTR